MSDSLATAFDESYVVQEKNGPASGGCATMLLPFGARNMVPEDQWITYQPAQDPKNALSCPPPLPISLYSGMPLVQREELIQGIMRDGQKMMLAGASKAGKTFLLMELAIAIARGSTWLGIPCKEENVLYVNMELEESMAIMRFRCIGEHLGLDWEKMDQINICTLRGENINNTRLYRYLTMAQETAQKPYGVIIIDPIYKLLEGDENATETVRSFCSMTDRLCKELNVSVIYSHHHSKGSKGNTRAMDRSSGSGIFARDADALLDLIELDMPAKMLEKEGNENLSAWRLEPVLRDFPAFKPLNLFFRFPIHEVDQEGVLSSAGAASPSRNNLKQSSKRITKEERNKSVREAFDALEQNGEPILMKTLVEKIGVTEQCVRQRLKELPDEFWVKAGLVGRKG